MLTRTWIQECFFGGLGVRDHAEPVADREQFTGFAREPLRDAGQGIALIQAQLDRRVEGRLGADQRDVGPVQRGEGGDAPVGVEHFDGHPGADGVGQGVMQVQHVQADVADDVVDRSC